MSYINEFPHTDFYGSDLRELLAMYKKLSEDYSTIKSEIDTAVDFINNFKEYVDDIAAELLEVRLTNVNAKLDAITEAIKRIDLNIDDIEGNITELMTDVEMLRNHVESEFVTIRLEIATIYEVFAEYKNSIDEIIAVKIQEMLKYIEEHVQQLERLYVINPMTGEYVNIQSVLDMFAEYIALGYGLTAKEYDDLQLTAIAYDNLRITALAYSMRAYLIFFKRIEMTMLSPFTGQADSYDNIIHQLANLHKDSLTAEAYDNLTLLAELYEMLGIDAYHFDWNGKVIAAQAI